MIRGCVPKKLLVYGSKFAHEFEDAAAFGWTRAAPTHSWPTLRDNVNKEVDRLNGVYIRLLDGAGVKLHMGRGRLMDRHTIEVGGQTITAEKILVATGGRPVCPTIPGSEFAITSNEAFHLPELPKRIAIVGGGYIARRVRRHLQRARRRGRPGAAPRPRAARLRRGMPHRRARCAEGKRRQDAHRDADRSASSDQNGDKAPFTRAHPARRHVRDRPRDVRHRPRAQHQRASAWRRWACKLDKAGAIAVDEWSKTTAPNIWAVGDVTDRINLTPVAIMEGHCFADTEFGNKPRKPDHRDVPSAVFCQPELANVGLTEEEAQRCGWARSASSPPPSSR